MWGLGGYFCVGFRGLSLCGIRGLSLGCRYYIGGVGCLAGKKLLWCLGFLLTFTNAYLYI